MPSLPLVAVSCLARSTLYPPGWNGLGERPQLGWRSWNQFGSAINASLILESARALARCRPQHGNASLCDLGFCSVGVDEGWEGCGLGINGTQHAADGTPVAAPGFGNISRLVEEIHRLGVQAGFYLNGCKCGEKTERNSHYEGDVRALRDWGFDSVKFDNCGEHVAVLRPCSSPCSAI